MSSQEALPGWRPPPSTVPHCPNCREPMVLKRKKRIMFTDGLADGIYRCEDCRTEIKWTVKYP